MYSTVSSDLCMSALRGHLHPVQWNTQFRGWLLCTNTIDKLAVFKFQPSQTLHFILPASMEDLNASCWVVYMDSDLFLLVTKPYLKVPAHAMLPYWFIYIPLCFSGKLCACVCVCMCVCVYVCIVCVHVRMCVCVLHVCTCVWLCVYMCACMYVCMYVGIDALRMCVCLFVLINVFELLCKCVRMCVYLVCLQMI